MTSVDLKSMVKDVLERIQGFRTTSERYFVENRVKAKNNAFWHKFWRRPDFTYEQVLEEEEQKMCYGTIAQIHGSELRAIRESYQDKEVLAHQLWVATDYAPVVNITTKDLASLLSVPPRSVFSADKASPVDKE